MNEKYTSLIAQPSLLSLTHNSKTHCVRLIADAIILAVSNHYTSHQLTRPQAQDIVSVEDNYTLLGYKDTDVTLSEKYTKYVDAEKTIMLRTQMSSAIPHLLRNYSASDKAVLWALPGRVYRRDEVDKTHVSTPHQMDLWLIDNNTSPTYSASSRQGLLELIEVIIKCISKIVGKPIKYRTNETSHPYTLKGLEVEIMYNNAWLEILECGQICPDLLTRMNLNSTTTSGLALGMGLERLAMIIKSVSDIRVLYESYPAIKEQMYDLKKYKEISRQPRISRDMSLVVNNSETIESLTERIMELDIGQILGEETLVQTVEEIKIINSWTTSDLPQNVSARLGMNNHHINVLVRITLASLTRSIESEKANELYSLIYSSLNKGNNVYEIKN